RAAGLGQSVGELSRQLVLERLLEVQATAVFEQSLGHTSKEIQGIRDSVCELRGDFVTGLKAILVTAGKVPSHEVDAWTEANFGGTPQC
ncbi:MAG TPA: hypothetical protein DCE44_13665, partial [Verrucomicrobiales bacterium]|nr:hypothetical protein [Verrucomicrobiales bacterium]